VNVIFTPEAFNQPAGGISRIFTELASGLQNHGHFATVAAGLYVNTYIRGLPAIRGKYVPRFPRAARAALNTALSHLTIATSPNAIVHQTYYSRHSYSRKHPLVVTVFDMIHELYPDLLASSGTVAKTVADKRYCCERADHICAISECTKADMVRILGIEESKVSVTYLGNALRDIVPASIGPDEGIRFLLYVGGRRWYKNFRTLLSVFASSEILRSNFVLICFGGGPFWPDELGLIEKLGLQDHVFLRSGSDELLAGYYRHASAHVSVSLYEGFGLTLLEAMGAGCPVICSNRGSLPEVAAGAAVYFDPEDPISMRRALEETLGNPAALADLTTTGTKREKDFTWDRCVDATLEVYRKVQTVRS
jgi:glycosyltransferase involved in cell wall biosynthesis